MAADELAAVVAVESYQRHRQALVHAMDGAPDALLVLAPDCLELDPGRGDVDGAERTEIEAPRAVAAVRDQIDFQEAGRASSQSVKARTGISWRSRWLGRVIVAPRRGNCARAGASRRARVGRLICRSSLSTSGETVSSPQRSNRSSSSATKGWSR
jgi:hypothetical protein